ncbi:MAG: DUF5688 family protein [Muricomes sp.]
MEYQEFLCAVERELNKKLKEGVRATIYVSQKNNGKEKKGILFQSKELRASPAIYLEGLYGRFRQGEAMDCLIREIQEFYEAIEGREIYDYRLLQEFDRVKDKIVLKVIHTKKNEKLLESIPFIEVLDLAIVFYVLLEVDKAGSATVQISREYLEMWGITKEELHQLAIKNSAILLPAEFFTMEQAIEKMLDADSGEEENLLKRADRSEDDVMYVLTNSLRNYGAACLCYPHVLYMIGEMLEEDFFILPSSVHEVIIVPESKGLDTEEMNEMIVEINETQVAPEEVLSNHVYFYERNEGKLISGTSIE